MQVIVLILIVAIAAVAIAYIAAFVGLVFGGCLFFLQYLPEWIWTLFLVVLTLVTLRGFRSFPK